MPFRNSQQLSRRMLRLAYAATAFETLTNSSATAYWRLVLPQLDRAVGWSSCLPANMRKTWRRRSRKRQRRLAAWYARSRQDRALCKLTMPEIHRTTERLLAKTESMVRNRPKSLHRRPTQSGLPKPNAWRQRPSTVRRSSHSTGGRHSRQPILEARCAKSISEVVYHQAAGCGGTLDSGFSGKAKRGGA